jgi:post-segregation antitoxin (ccd killing protein)
VATMGKYATVSVKIPTTLKEELQRLGIKPSKLPRKAIEDEVKRKEVERIRSEIRELMHRVYWILCRMWGCGARFTVYSWVNAMRKRYL